MKNLLNTLQEKNRLHILILFVLTTVLCVGLVALRVHYTSKITFVLLIWNIFLALVPYTISTLLILFHEKIENRMLLVFPFLAWLCFFPNAPYILTDLFHLKQRIGVPYWFDLALILFFAWNGLMLGYASLMDIQSVIAQRFNKLIGWVIATGSLVLASFGIYLGRYLRWNSWDVVSSPLGLLKDISDVVVNPAQHPRTYGVTSIFSVFLLLGYLMIFHFANARATSSAVSKH
jgi:uncharacterized membrane protein